MQREEIRSLGGFVWSIADILRGDFKQSEYGKVILPFVVLRRLDCILESSKVQLLNAVKTLPEGVDEATRDMILFGAVGDSVKRPTVNGLVECHHGWSRNISRPK